MADIVAEEAARHPDTPVEAFATDEQRIGLKPVTRRVWAPVGKRPISQGHHRFEWLYVTAFVSPATGEVFGYVSNGVSKPFLEALLRLFAEEVGAGRDRIVVLVLDNAGRHGQAGLVVPEGIRLVFQPAYTPEVQRAETLSTLVDEPIVSKHVPDLETLDKVISARCAPLAAERPKSKAKQASTGGPISLTRGDQPEMVSLYRRHRFPPEIISQAVWLYFRFPLSLRMVEELLAARRICVTYETVRQWGIRFGKAFADQIHRRAPARGDKWHMDEVVVSIAGETHWLWRAVDQNGFVLDVLVQRRRDAMAAQQLLKSLLKSARTPPRVMTTDKLRAYGAAKARMSLRIEHRQHKGLNNRAENSYQPTRRRERIMKRFKSARQAQRFLTVHDQIGDLFHFPYPESVSADRRRALRARAFVTWRQTSKTKAAA